MQDLRGLIESVNASDATRLAETSRFVEEQKIKRALGPNEWERLKEAFRSHCDAIQKSTAIPLQFDESGINELSIRNLRNGKLLTLAYNDDVPCVLYRTPVDRGHLGFRVNPDGTMLQFMAKGQPTVPDEIAVVLLSQMMDS